MQKYFNRSAKKIRIGCVEHDLCNDCMSALALFMNYSIENDTVEKEHSAREAMVVSFSPHDCETIYQCPYCNETFGSYSIVKKTIR